MITVRSTANGFAYPLMNWETFFLEQLALIERVVAFVGRRHGLSGADAEDFASSVKLKLIENDYAVLQKFEKKCSLQTFLTVVIQRLYLDQRIHEWGKWRPSARARHHGDAAVLLERLVSRDGLSLAEASTLVRQQYPEVDEKAVEALSASITIRQPRRSANVDSTEEVPEPASNRSAEDDLLSHEREANAERASKILNREIERLPAEDRLIVKLRFIDSMKVSSIALLLSSDQKQLYRRIDRMVARFRQSLLSEGLGTSEIGDLLLYGADALDVRVREEHGMNRYGPPRPPSENGPPAPEVLR